MRFTKLAALLAATVLLPAAASAAVRITEFTYQGFNGDGREFFELTNIGSTAVNVTGWSYNDDNSNDPILFSSLNLTSIGANESIVFTNVTAAAFRSYWNLPTTVRIFSYGSNSNLGNGDQINIYNSSTTQDSTTRVDGITYANGTTRGVSLNRPVGGDGATPGSSFVYSRVGDVFGSRYAAAVNASDLGNPGFYPAPAAAAVPEPASWALMLGGFGLVGGALRRRRATIAFA